jgi:hypothetical protein
MWHRLGRVEQWKRAVPSRTHLRVLRRHWHDVATPGRLGDATASAQLPQALRVYLRFLHNRPLAGAAAGSALAAAAGDVLSQVVQVTGLDMIGDAYVRHDNPYSAMADLASRPRLAADASPEYGVARTVRFAAVVGGLVGCAGELWYRRLLVSFPGWTYEVVLRTIVDQALFAPAVLGLTIGAVTAASTADLEYARFRIRHDTIDPLGRMWTLWGCGLSFSYLSLPSPWQPPFAMALGVVWCAIVSTRLHRPIVAEGDDVERKASHLRGQRAFEGTGRSD